MRQYIKIIERPCPVFNSLDSGKLSNNTTDIVHTIICDTGVMQSLQTFISFPARPYALNLYAPISI